MDLDVLAVQEVEDIDTLRQFARDVFDRTLGRPKQQREFGRSLEQWPDMDAALAQAHQKLARGSAAGQLAG
jgi:phage baseplate assembly protein W